MEMMLRDIQQRTATPDHVIRVKPFPLIIKPKHNSSIDDFKKTATKAFINYKKILEILWIESKKVKEKKTMLDTHQEWY